MAISMKQARAAKNSAKTVLSAMPCVVGVGITKIGDDYALKVNLSEALPAGVTMPAHIDNVSVRVEIVGTITKRM